MCTAKFETFLLNQFFLKIGHVLIHQISLMKNNQNFKSPHKQKLRKQNYKFLQQALVLVTLHLTSLLE